MPLSIASRIDHNVPVLELSGPLTLGPSLQALRKAAQKALDSAGAPGLLLDVSKVTMTDSAGIGELTVVYSLATRKKSALLLVGVPAHMRKILEITRLEALLPSAPDMESAQRKMKSSLPA